MANKCKECGCPSKKCASSDDHDVHLHVEIENLKQKLLERENHIVNMETNFLNEANKFPSGELVALREELLTWQDKYRRLYDAHRRVQRVNQGLEDKLLKLVDVCETDKTTLTKDVAILSQKLAEANYTIKKLTLDNDRYKDDVSLAIQFLQCKQSNFVAHKYDSLPPEVQVQVSSFMTNKRKPEEKKVSYEMKSIKVPIPTFPPTAMVYSIPKSPRPERRPALEAPDSPPVDIVSAAIMAKVLEERQKDRAFAKHCDTCTCSKKLNIIYNVTHHTIGTQTGDFTNSLCLRCNDTLLLTSSDNNNPQRIVVVKHSENNNAMVVTKKSEEPHHNGNIVVKVQPNNFLLDHVSPSPPPPNSSSQALPVDEQKPLPNVSFFSVNEISNETRVQVSPSRVEITKLHNQLTHHHLCNSSSKNNNVSSNGEEKSDESETSAKNEGSSVNKGPRYCSMRLQSGTRNVLLDNAQKNSVAPVLYTRHHKIISNNSNSRQRCDEEMMIAQTHEKKSMTPEESCVSSSEDAKNFSILSDNSTHNQQRVADWIQNNLDNEVSSSDNSQSETFLHKVKNRNCGNFQSVLVLGREASAGAEDGGNVGGRKEKQYAEMEENVKRFLFGESEFLKTVEIGKLKYQNYKENEEQIDVHNSSRSNSHTETKI